GSTVVVHLDDEEAIEENRYGTVGRDIVRNPLLVATGQRRKWKYHTRIGGALDLPMHHVRPAVARIPKADDAVLGPGTRCSDHPKRGEREGGDKGMNAVSSGDLLSFSDQQINARIRNNVAYHP